MEELSSTPVSPPASGVESTCPFCHVNVVPNQYFCQNCGKKLHEPPPSIGRQIYIYAVSILLPPIGLWYGAKYFHSPNAKVRMIGWIAIILTLVSLIISIIMLVKATQYFSQQLNSQMQEYQNLGI